MDISGTQALAWKQYRLYITSIVPVGVVRRVIGPPMERGVIVSCIDTKGAAQAPENDCSTAFEEGYSCSKGGGY